MIAVRAVMAAFAVVLVGCAGPRLVNPGRPSAELRVDTAACDREAERVAKRELLANPGEVNNDCLTCRVTPGGREMRASTMAQLAHQRCLAGKGWRASS